MNFAVVTPTAQWALTRPTWGVWLLGCAALWLLLTPLAAKAQAAASGPALKSSAPAKPAQTSKRKKTTPAAALAPAEPELSAGELALAQRVMPGKFPCEQGMTLNLVPDPEKPGYFDIEIQNHQYHVHPVPTTTGALRLEDPKQGLVMLQLGNKTMLMNQKQGRRVADGCINPEQAALAEELRLHPRAGLLDAPVAEGALPESASK